MERQGLVIVHTGNGKGKTTAALGMGIRAWGQGLRVLVLQFIKGSWKYGELKAAEQLGSRFTIKPLGEGFVNHARGGATQSDVERTESHRLAAAEALKRAKTAITSGNWDMIILDESNYAVKFGLITLEDVLELISLKPASVHLVLTGRDARPELIERADLVTEMKPIKHPYEQGISAQPGIEF